MPSERHGKSFVALPDPASRKGTGWLVAPVPAERARRAPRPLAASARDSVPRMPTYRDPDRTPRCQACGGTSLTEETLFSTLEGDARVYFEVVTGKEGFFSGKPRAEFHADRARVCLECGHVMIALGARQLENLRQQLHGLAALPDRG